MKRTSKNRYDFYSSMPNVMAIISWILMLIAMVFQQIKTSDAVKFKGDSCLSKNQPGICKEWGECPVIKTLIESGQYTNREVVSCGFGVREELICCPELRTNTNTETTTITNTDRFVIPTTTTTQSTVTDFWLDLIMNTTTTTTIKPDFWLDLLTTTSTVKPTTTTKPLIVRDQRLNQSSEFFDLNALLSGKHTGGSKQERQVTTIRSTTNLNDNVDLGVSANQDNGRGNLNQWVYDESGNNLRGNGNNGRGQGNVWNQNNNRGQANVWNQNNGRGQNNAWNQNNGRGQGNVWSQNSGRVQHNNGRGRPGIGNQNRGFVFPDGNTRPNEFFENEAPSSRRPNRPFNNMVERNPNTNIANLLPGSSLHPTIPQTKNDNTNEEEKIENLIKNVFDTSFNSNHNAEESVANQEKTLAGNLKETTTSVFNLKPQIGSQTPELNSFNNKPVAPLGNSPSVNWISPQDSGSNPVEFIQLPSHQIQPQHQHQEQVVFQNPHMTGYFETIPTVEPQINGNDLQVAPSTNFIQQPVVVETWSNNPIHQPEFNPVQVVYENLINSGIDIVKSNELQHQQQQFVQQPQVFVVQPQISNSQHFAQPTQQVFFQQPQHLIQQPLEQLIEQPHQQNESLMKEPRSPSPIFQQSNTSLLPNIQSPPAQILDPFKPFEFRPQPGNENIFSEDNNSLSPNPTPTQRDSLGDRPAVKACRRIEKGLIASLSPHILGGTPAELGEFPHMVAIGYSRIGGDNRPPYDIRCGGTLIDKRFVLTAAHCVSDRESIPTIVRLGVVNFTDPDQMSQAVELRIKETFIHDNYSTRLTYNDIAILELEREVETNEYIYPVCLYTNETDPDTKIKLWVTGWGTVNTTTRSFSDILLKAPLHTSPLENCNRSFTEYGLNRRIPEGIIRTQFCAEDKDQIKDACQGDSGGPLNLIVDESLKNYRLVGVVSSGFGCASSTPGLYTRVAAFLDFIEKIVWPNGGD